MANPVGGTYSFSGDPRSSALDETRHLVGDTDLRPGQPMFTDEQILYALAEAADSPRSAAGSLLDQAAMRAAVAPVSRTVGDLSVTYSQTRATDLRSLAETYREGFNNRVLGCTRGGSSGLASVPFVRRDQAGGLGDADVGPYFPTLASGSTATST